MRSQGRSEFSMQKLVDDVVGVIHHLKHEKCILVGHGEYPACTWTPVSSWDGYNEAPNLASW